MAVAPPSGPVRDQMGSATDCSMERSDERLRRARREQDEFSVIARAVISDFGTEAAGKALVLRATRRISSTYLILRLLAAATILSSLIFFLFFSSSALAQSEPPGQPPRQFNLPGAAEPGPRGAQPQQQTYGTVSGRVVDQTGNGVPGAHVKLVRDEESVIQEVQCDQDGEFIFLRVLPGTLQLTIVAEGFATQTVSNTLPSGENYVFPQIMLSLATQITEIRVTPPVEEIGQEQFKDLEKQRVLGFVPNFYVSYIGEAAPLSSSEKFRLALKATADPATVLLVGVNAGVGQAADRFSGYGQGAQGYAKRYAASYGNLASGLFVGGAVLPSLLKQDPRYYYKGRGTGRSRFLYAVSRTFICKGDNQRWQPNYSVVLGYLAAGGISNLYIPERDRHGASLTFQNAAIGIGSSAVINVLQEFVLHRFTSKR